MLTIRVLVSLAMFLGAASARAEDKSAVGPSSLKLPKGPGSLEGVGEDAELNLSMGLMSWGVTLELPQGHEGVTPSLRLGYSSGGGNSVVGIGWSVGAPSVSRMTNFGLPHYTVDDRFTGVGGELVHVGQDTNGDRVYRSRYESSFARHTWVDPTGADYWRVETPDGVVHFYGADGSGTPVQAAREEGQEGTFRYHLVESVNPYGESVVYDWIKDAGTSLLSDVRWVFREGGESRYRVVFTYEDRQDQLVDGKPGFEVRLAKRLSDIHVLAEGVQRRHYALAYESYADSGGLSRLSSIRQYGTDPQLELEVRFAFSYSDTLGGPCASLGCFRPTLVEMAGNVGDGLRIGSADLVDMNGDALPDVLDTQNGHEVYLNLLDEDGGHGFEPALATGHTSAGLDSPDVHMVDMNGDGFVDLFDDANDVVYYGRGDGGWDEVATTLEVPDLGAGSQLRFFDVDSDKELDLLYSDGTDTWFLRNKGDGTFSTTPELGDELDGSYVTQLDAAMSGGLQLADMNGDGLQDPVFVTVDGLVGYRTNFGHGRFSAEPVEMLGLSPDTIAAEMRLVDANGDGLSDAVFVQSGIVSIALNQNGATFAAPVEITSDGVNAVPLNPSGQYDVRFADMNANGSRDIVWVDAQGKVLYLELYPVRPNLLARIDNSIGKLIDISYSSSVEMMAKDGGPDSWRHRLPNAMQLVDRIETWDAFSETAQVDRIHYRHGFYDGEENRFRGFEEAILMQDGDASVASLVQTHVFDVGATDPYHSGLLVEVSRSSDGPDGFFVVDVTRHAYDDCALADVPDTTPPIRWVCERSIERVRQEGRESSEWVTTFDELAYDGYGNKTLTKRHGIVSIGGGGCDACVGNSDDFGDPCGAQCLGDELYEEATFVPPTSTGGLWLLRKPVSDRVYGKPGAETTRERRYYYDGEGFIGLPLGELSHGSVARISARANAAGDFVDEARQLYNDTGKALAFLDANDHLRTVEYDADDLLVVAEVLWLDDPGHPPYELRMEAEYDPVLDAMLSHTDWIRLEEGVPVSAPRRTYYGFDPFARVTAIARPGDTLERPTEAFEYDLGAPVSRIVRYGRSESGAAQPDLAWAICFDGRGRELQTRTQVAPGEVLVDKLLVRNARSLTWRKYEPYTDTDLTCDSEPAASARFEEEIYDGTGRVIEVRMPDHDLYGERSIRTTRYEPRHMLVRDAADHDTGSAELDTPTITTFDGLERPVKVTRVGDGGELINSWRLYDHTGEVSGWRDDAGNVHRQHFDARGRLLRTEDPDEGVTLYAYDDVGNRIGSTDARGVTVQYTFDELGRVTAYWDAADREASQVALFYDRAPDCEGECGHGEGKLAAVRYGLGEDRLLYDERGRVAEFERDVDGHRFTLQTDYDAQDRIIEKRLPGGQSLRFLYDGGNRLTSVPGVLPKLRYDARGLPLEVEHADGTRKLYQHDSVRRLAHHEVVDEGGAVLFGQDVSFDRVGNVLAIEDLREQIEGPSTSAAFTYDGLSRLKTAVLDPGRAGYEESYSFAFDALDNLLSKTSAQPHAVGHAGAYLYESGKPHAPTRIGERELSYDDAGNVVAIGDIDLERDHLERVVSISAGGVLRQRIDYGPHQERVRRQRDGISSYFISDEVEAHGGLLQVHVRVGGRRLATISTSALATELLGDASGDGVVSAADAFLSRAHEEQTDELLLASALALLEAGGGVAVEHHHHDFAGNPVMRSRTEGSPVFTPYGPFGEARAVGRSDNVYRMVGGAGYQDFDYEDDLGLVAHGARWYSPRLGIFLKPDPTFSILRDGSLDAPRTAMARYTYAGGNPISYRDDDGRVANWIVGALAGLVAGVAGTYIGEFIKQFTTDNGAISNMGLKQALANTFDHETNMEALKEGAIGAGLGLLTSGGSAATAFAQITKEVAGEVMKDLFKQLIPEVVKLVANQLGGLDKEDSDALGALVGAVLAGKKLTEVLSAKQLTRIGELAEQATKSFGANVELTMTLSETYKDVAEQGYKLFSKVSSHGASWFDGLASVGAPAGLPWMGSTTVAAGATAINRVDQFLESSGTYEFFGNIGSGFASMPGVFMGGSPH